MTSTTVAEFANELKKPIDTLLEQLKSAGVAKTGSSDELTDADKQKLLAFLKNTNGTVSAPVERKKITLVKKSTSEIKQADATGKARTIQVEVRKKRTFVKRDDDGADEVQESHVPAESSESSTSTSPSVQASILDQAELARREEEARRQAELIRRQEEELAEKRRVRQEQEAKERAIQEAAIKEKAEKAEKAGASKDALVDEQMAIDAEKLLADQKAEQAKALALEDENRAKELEGRRNTALAEAEAIRAMMNAPAPKKPVIVKKPVAEKPKEKEEVSGKKGTIHKPATGSATPAAAKLKPAVMQVAV